MNRWSWIRILIVLAIGIPLIIEAVTFAGLVDQRLGGGSGTGESTPSVDRVGEGDEVLPASPQVEILTDAAITDTQSAWILHMAVVVENTADQPYEFRLSHVTLVDGTQIAGGGSSGQIPPGQTGTVRGEWVIPSGSTPMSLRVIGVIYGETGQATQTIHGNVRLASIPVQGGQ